MNKYIVLLRGINVGGKNKISMQELKICLENFGFQDVVTYIQSGNVILKSRLNAEEVASKIENLLPRRFMLDSKIIKALAINKNTYEQIISEAPKEFGSDIKDYRYDVIFLIGINSSEAMREIELREGVDTAWQGRGVIYFQRPSLSSPDATKSRLGKIIGKPIYKFMTIRNWNTSAKLLEVIKN